MSVRIHSNLLRRVNCAIEAYALISGTEVAVATSGGKDSVFCCLALRELGYNVQPILIDMGYSADWASRVRENLASLGLSSTILDAKYPAALHSSAPLFTESLTRNLTLLQLSVDKQESAYTPCTNCYNSKALLLHNFLREEGIDRVVFAHHATDMVSSFLKSALMYVDRWDRGHPTFSRDQFTKLTDDSYNMLSGDNPGPLLHRLRELAASQQASTDEPPIEWLIDASGPQIVRPLIDVWEHEIKQSMSSLAVPVESSGCGHSLSIGTQTPRELVQFGIVNLLEEADIAPLLLSIAQSTFDSSGHLFTDTRRRRSELLGTLYKPAADGLDKI